MKKIIKYALIILIVILAAVGIFYYYKNNYSQVTVYINDVDKVKIYNVHNNKTLKKLENPSMDGYAFIGWYYLDSEEKFDFSTKVTEDVTIVAKWAKVTIE